MRTKPSRNIRAGDRGTIGKTLELITVNQYACPIDCAAILYRYQYTMNVRFVAYLYIITLWLFI